MKIITVIAITILIATSGKAQSLKGFTVGQKINENTETITTVAGVPGMIIPQTNLNDIIYSLMFIPIDKENSKENSIVTNNKLPSYKVEQFLVDVQHHYQIQFKEAKEDGVKVYSAQSDKIIYLVHVPDESTEASASFIFTIADVSATRANSSDF